MVLRYGLAAFSSLFVVLAFPNFNQAWLAWVCLTPLTLAVIETPRHEAFWIGWFAGTFAYVGIFFWLFATYAAAHQSWLLASFSVLALSAYLGLFWGAWGWIVAPLRSPWRLVFIGACAWVALEFLRTHLFSGFPWTLLADSQVSQLSLIQIASVTGAYGISFLLALVSVTIGVLIWSPSRPRSHDIAPKRATSRSAPPLAFVVGILVLLVWGVGRYRLSLPLPQDGPAVRVALLQGSIDQYKKWNQAYVDEIKTTYANLVHRAAADHPDLIVWPETSVPGYLLQDPPLHQWLTDLVRETTTYHLVGAPVYHERAAYNSAFLLNPQGVETAEYAKQHLVPFGEIVPFGRILGRWIRVLNELGGFAAGRGAVVMDMGDGRKIGPSVCYEAIFPSLVRRPVRLGATLLVNITNDGWYMHTAAPYQHFAPNILRAVENDRYLLRADNTGVSAIIDPRGHVLAASRIFETTLVTGTAYPVTKMTIFTRCGNLFAWICFFFTLLSLAGSTRQYRD